MTFGIEISHNKTEGFVPVDSHYQMFSALISHHQGLCLFCRDFRINRGTRRVTADSWRAYFVCERVIKLASEIEIVVY